MDDMIRLLVDSKVLCADLALQLEEEKKKNHVLRRRMQKYAEKMGAMELAAVIEGLRRKDEIGSSNSWQWLAVVLHFCYFIFTTRII